MTAYSLWMLTPTAISSRNEKMPNLMLAFSWLSTTSRSRQFWNCDELYLNVISQVPSRPATSATNFIYVRSTYKFLLFRELRASELQPGHGAVQMICDYATAHHVTSLTPIHNLNPFNIIQYYHIRGLLERLLNPQMRIQQRHGSDTAIQFRR